MAITVEPASSSYDEQVRDLFTEARIPVLPAYWQRHYSPENPEGPSTPYVALDDVQGVVGFMAVRRMPLNIMGDVVSVGLVHDFVTAAHLAEGDLPRILMDEALKLSDLTVVCGAGPSQSKLLGQLHFLCAGYYHRAAAGPDAEPAESDERPGGLVLRSVPEIPASVESFNEEMETERRIFRPRTCARLSWAFRGPATGYEVLVPTQESEQSAYAILKQVEGRAEEELVVVDFACRALDMRHFARALAKLAVERDRTVHLPVFGERWKRPLAEAGFEFLKPRWPVYWMLADPKLRVLGNSLLRKDAWFFTAADGELDMW